MPCNYKKTSKQKKFKAITKNVSRKKKLRVAVGRIYKNR